jgi:hypothetical protein
MPFREDIKSPFNLLMLALAIVGVSAGFYFYCFPHNERGIAYTAEVPSLIYDSRISSPAIHLVDSQNAPITSDTYLQTFTVWNSGSAPIEPTDVRRPMMVMFQGAERILDCKIVNALDQDVCGFELSKSNSTGVEISNAVGLTWKHFDPKTGVKFQVIFEQKTKPVALLVGDIVGVSKFQAGIKQRSWKNFAFSLFQLCNVIFLLRFVLWDDLRSKKKVAIAFAVILEISAGSLVWSMTSQTLLSPTPPNL